MNKRLFALLLCCALLLCGCQLAVGSEEDSAQRDRLVGVFLTTEHLDLFDMEAYLNDHASQLLQGGDIQIEDDSQYLGRIWATLVDEGRTQRYVFEDLEGILLASYLVNAGENSYWTSDAGEGFSEVATHHTSTDEGERLELSGTVYMESDCGEAIFYHNLVYQTPDGQLYLVPGSGTSVNGTLGGNLTVTHSEEGTLTQDSVTEENRTQITVSMDFVELASRVELLQFDSGHNLLASQSCIPGQMPGELAVLPETAYILVQETLPSGLRRTLYQPGDDSIGVFCALKDHICVQDRTVLEWPNS